MKTVIVRFPEGLAKELAKYPNQSETLREAFRVYNGAISTDTLAGMRLAFERLLKKQADLEQRFVEQYEMVEKMFAHIEEMRNR